MITTDYDWQWDIRSLERWAKDIGHYQTYEAIERYRQFLSDQGGADEAREPERQAEAG